YVEMRRLDPDEIDRRQVLGKLPPLIKGYLRLGGFVGDGAVIDWQFNTTDVAVLVKTDLVTEKYVKHYERQSREANDWAAGAKGEANAGIVENNRRRCTDGVGAGNVAAGGAVCARGEGAARERGRRSRDDRPDHQLRTGGGRGDEADVRRLHHGRRERR